MEEFTSAPPQFDSVDQEVAYWRQRSEHFEKKFEDQKEQFDEFEKYSKDYEAELELELKQLESKNKELMSSLQRVATENETLKLQKEQMRDEYDNQLAELTTEVTSCKGTSDEVNSYVRELEQKNDDLERTNRAAIESIQDFEAKLNFAIERNAILESEQAEAEQLREVVQRLKDETKDLENELIRRRASIGTPTTPLESRPGFPQTPTTEPRQYRASPLTVVHDLLRKVGVLETKLVGFNKDHSLRRALHKEYNAI